MTSEPAPRSWMRRRLLDPILAQLKQGLSPERLAASLALGLGCAVFPIFGATTALCIGVALIFKLNQPAMQVVNHVAGPLQVLLILPFIRMGEWLFGAPRLPLDTHQILAHVKSAPLEALRFLWTSTWHAIVAWALVAPAASVLLTLLIIPVLRRVLPRSLRAPESARS